MFLSAKMTSRRSTRKSSNRISSTTSSERKECSEDYIQNPELWKDTLPQPFRMIDEVLQSLLAITWERINQREVSRREEAMKPKVAISRTETELSISKVNILCSTSCTDATLAIAGCADGLHTLSFSTDGTPEVKKVECADTPEVLAMDCTEVRLSEYTTTVVVTALKQGVHFYLMHKNDIYHLKDVETGEEREPVHCVLSKGVTHLALVYQGQVGSHILEVYQIPILQWSTQLRPTLARQDASVEGGEAGPVDPPDPATLNKPFLVLSLPSPPLTPSADTDSSVALASAFSESKHCIANGDRHILTETYFNSRLKVFLHERRDFITEPLSFTGDAPSSIPYCHFLHFKSGTHSPEAGSVLVWWKGTAKLHQYSLAHSPKAKELIPVLERVFPLASPITCAAISEEGGLLAVGQQNGLVAVTDLKSNIYDQLFVVSFGFPITSLTFHSGHSHTDPLLYAGNSRGNLFKLDGSRSENEVERITNHILKTLKVPTNENTSPVKQIVVLESDVLLVQSDCSVLLLGNKIVRFKPDQDDIKITDAVVLHNGQVVFMGEEDISPLPTDSCKIYITG